jgi:phosphodiesterase/alkaline phosphatase D-like protein
MINSREDTLASIYFKNYTLERRSALAKSAAKLGGIVAAVALTISPETTETISDAMRNTFQVNVQSGPIDPFSSSYWSSQNNILRPSAPLSHDVTSFIAD